MPSLTNPMSKCYGELSIEHLKFSTAQNRASKGSGRFLGFLAPATQGTNCNESQERGPLISNGRNTGALT